MHQIDGVMSIATLSSYLFVLLLFVTFSIITAMILVFDWDASQIDEFIVSM